MGKSTSSVVWDGIASFEKVLVLSWPDGSSSDVHGRERTPTDGIFIYDFPIVSLDFFHQASIVKR